ncbi:MAG: DUF3368 domain-containing protein [Anaerolineae bacterium]|nr:DUF3368 domain-containing protein [Anaerolineae bacterium]
MDSLSAYDGWLKIVDPRSTPSEWLALDLGRGELAAMALALENPERTILLDDELARRTAKAAGLKVRGTLGILLDAKSQGLTERVEPLIERLGAFLATLETPLSFASQTRGWAR